MNNAVVSWSGGKDSCFAVMQAVKLGIETKVLLNVLNEEGRISRSHGIPAKILLAQAQVSSLPIKLIESSWQDYEHKFIEALIDSKEDYKLSHCIFGDIDLQAHRDWEEKVCAKAALTACLPLWKQNRKELVLEMMRSGIKTIIVSCNEKMGKAFIGKELTPTLVAELEKAGIDPCGENGEFHTLVTHCPLFKHPVNVLINNTEHHDQYWFAELEL